MVVELGFAAMTFQVTSLMWLRTMNHQYRNGNDFKKTISILYKDGGILRFYRGYPFALMLAPLSGIWRYSNEYWYDDIFRR